MLKDGYESKGDGPSEELQEVEEELIEKKEGAAFENSPDEDVEQGEQENRVNTSHDLSKETVWAHLERAVLSLRLTDREQLTVFIQAFTLTFLAEWGDRSQIATIALGSVKDPFGVIFGGLVGHAFCTGVAVIGGRMLAARISEKTVAIIGGLSFLGFGIHSFVVGP